MCTAQTERQTVTHTYTQTQTKCFGVDSYLQICHQLDYSGDQLGYSVKNYYFLYY